jgi:glyoxylase-like metal-dependent hydrolase (beta-lactamase superfamily II)
MISLASGVSYVDVQFLGRPRLIASVVLHGPGGVAIVDPGPTSTLPTLRQALEQAGLSLADVRALLLTHIHLDHAGAAGTIVRERPDVRVFVHEKGAPHLVDPSKLLASATRLYGEHMDRLWGDVLPVPEAALTVLRGGERIAAGGRDFAVAYTPGHASHHVSYFSRDTGIAFVGDTAGVRLLPDGINVPPTPPPDIDLDAWRESLAAIAAWNPSTLFITHFGPHQPVASHLAELADNLAMTADLARQSLAREGNDEEREAWFADEWRRVLRRRLNADDARAYEDAGRFDLNWRGLARYWRKRS